MQNMAHFGEFIRQHVEESGLTNDEFRFKSKVSADTLYRLFRSPTPEGFSTRTLRSVANAIGEDIVRIVTQWANAHAAGQEIVLLTKEGAEFVQMKADQLGVSDSEALMRVLHDYANEKRLERGEDTLPYDGGEDVEREPTHSLETTAALSELQDMLTAAGLTAEQAMDRLRSETGILPRGLLDHHQLDNLSQAQDVRTLRELWKIIIQQAEQAEEKQRQQHPPREDDDDAAGGVAGRIGPKPPAPPANDVIYEAASGEHKPTEKRKRRPTSEDEKN